jgi:hypothetical protein
LFGDDAPLVEAESITCAQPLPPPFDEEMLEWEEARLRAERSEEDEVIVLASRRKAHL